MPLLSVTVAIALLIAANALYVAAEFAAVAAPRARIRTHAEGGNARARWLLPVVDAPKHLDRYIAACQVGITLSSLVLGAFGQASLAPPIANLLGTLGGWESTVSQTAAFGLVLITLSIVQMVLGELVPKALALQFPVPTALLTTPPMAWSLRAFTPLIWVLNGSGLALLRLIGVRQQPHRHVHSPAEIELLLAEGDADGPLEPAERRRLKRALRLSNVRAADVMVPRAKIVAIPVESSLEAALQIGAEQPYTRFPVFRGSIDDTLGILHTKDAVRAHTRGAPPCIGDLLRPVLKLPRDAAADGVLATMREQRASQAMVLDATGRVIGMVTLRDVLGAVFDVLADEFKRAPKRPASRRVR